MNKITLSAKLFQPSHRMWLFQPIDAKTLSSTHARIPLLKKLKISTSVSYWGSNGLFKGETRRERIKITNVHATAVNATNAIAPKDAPEPWT